GPRRCPPAGPAPAAPTPITFAVNASANALSAAIYGPATITFTNTDSGQGNTTRMATLTVTPPPALQVGPATDMVAAGSQGGPFSPSSFSYQLSSTTGSIDYALSGVPSWLTASASSGTLTTSATTITFTVNAGANGLSPASYGATIAFTNATNGQGNTSRMATLTVRQAAGPGGGGGGAPSSKTWVSAAGNDGNACTLAAPCLTFQRALTQTTAGGEIGVLGPGSYGPLD